MVYMVIETFENPDLLEVRERFLTQGRLMPNGLDYVNSWMTSDGTQCYQVMESPSRELLDIWIGNWSDIVSFEVLQIKSSADFWSSWRQ